MKKREFKYILRFTLDTETWKDRAEALLRYCEKAKIDDVLFFTNCEELNNGHSTMKDLDYWLEGIAGMKKLLADIGVTTSLHSWTTVGHGDRGGRILKPGQNFETMVDMHGTKAKFVACFLSPEWQESISMVFARLAELKPAMIWVEDDCRFHNHDPLDWGGCFCDLHMKEFSEIAGKTLTREEFAKGVTAKEPHPYRTIWLDHCCKTNIATNRMMAKAVHAVSPETAVAVMTSFPETHCAEGRDWNGLFDALSDGYRTADRVGLVGYREISTQEYAWGYSTLARQLASIIPDEVEILPEIENFVYSYFTKSQAYTKMQLESSSVIGAAGITMNLFEFNGNGVMPNHDYLDVLSESKPRVSAFMENSKRVNKQSGVKVLFDTKSSYTLHNKKEGKMEGLQPDEEYFWTAYLDAMGISNVPSESRENSGAIAISGQYFRNLKEEEIATLLENNVCLLEGEAVFTLYDMELGHLLGIESAKVHKDDSGFASYETYEGNLCGIKNPKIRAQSWLGDFVEVKYSKTPRVLTKVHTYTRAIVAAGMCAVNERTFILPYIPLHHNASLFMPHRQQLIQEFLCKVAPKHFTSVLNKAYVYCIWSKVNENVHTFALANLSSDPHTSVEIRAPWLKGKKIMLTGVYDHAELISFDGDVLKVKIDVPHMSTRMIKIEV